MSAPLATSWVQSESFIYVLYIIAFALFIQGLRGLAGPTTAVRGNRIAAVGMVIAVVATLLNPSEGEWGLIALGVALGTAVGVPAARNVQALLELFVGEDGSLQLDWDDEIVKGAAVVRDGKIVNEGARAAVEAAA